MKKLKIIFYSTVFIFLSTYLYAQESSDPFGASITKTSSAVTNWFILIATGLFTVNLLLVVICHVSDFEWTKSIKPKVTKALIATILFFFISQLMQGSVGNALQKVQTCPLSLMGLHC